MSETLDNTIEQQKRPTFLTVLCILTFIGSGWGIISALMKEYAGYYYWVMLLLNVGTLFGAIQMWQMKKIGLYIWTASEVISLILMWVVIKGFVAHLTGDVDTGDSNLDSLVSTAANEAVASTMNFALILGSIFPAAFIIMYWLNAKHLK